MLRLLGLILAAGVAGCHPQQSEQTAEPPTVRIMRVGSDVSVPAISGAGTVALRREIDLGFTTGGRIATIAVNEGDIVRPGQVIAALDTTMVAADLARTRAERTRALGELRRSETLAAKGWVTSARLDDSRAAFQSAEAAVQTTRFQNATAVLRAPGPGIVLARLAEPGQIVPAGAPVISLGDSASGLVLRVPLTDRDVARVRVGASASVAIPALGPAPLPAGLIEIGGRAEKATGTFIVKLALPARPQLRSGQIGRASINVGGAEVANGRIVVPAEAIFAARAGQGFVYLFDARSGRARLRRVDIAELRDSGGTISAGLEPQDWLVVSGLDRLRDGLPVRALRSGK